MQKKLFYPLFAVIVIILFLLFYNINNNNYNPSPTEFINKDKDKKKFKVDRKKWIDNMHRSSPDVDWELLDKQNREKRIKKIISLRNDLYVNNKTIKNNFNYRENISRDINGEWFERGSNNLSGRILTSDIDFDNNKIYCGSDGGNIWKGDIQGNNWQSLNDYLQIKGMHFLRLIDHNNNKRLLISSNDKFYFSDNDCITLFEAEGLDFLDSWGWINRVVLKEDEFNTIYLISVESGSTGGAYSAIYKSIDHGETFEKIINLNENNGFDNLQNYNEFDIWTMRYFYSELYLLHNNEFYKINDDDELVYISDIPTTQNGDNVLTGGLNTNSPFFYARIDNEIYFSFNGGNSWVFKSEIPQWLFTKNSFNSSLVSPGTVFWGGVEAFKSINSASNWDLVNSWGDYYGDPNSKLHADIPEIRSFLNNQFNEVFLISTDGGLYISFDQLNNVNNLSLNGLGVSQYYSTYTKKEYPYSIYAGSQDQGFQRTVNDEGGILDFEQSISGDYGHLVSGDYGNTIWCNYPGFTMFYTNPQTDTWGATLDFPGEGHLWLAPLMENPDSPFSAFLGGGGISNGNYLIKLTYFNNSITFNEQPFNFGATISAMGYSPINNQNRYVLTENGYFYYSLDAGQNWLLSSTFTGLEPQYFYGSSIHALNMSPNTVLIGGSGYSNSPIFISYNNGITFSDFSTGIPNTLVYDICGTDNDDLLFAASELGPYVYSEFEGEWVYLGGLSAPDQTYWSCEYISNLNTIRFGTYGRGIWDFVLDDNYNINLGDVNLDNIINIQDIIIIINFIINANIPNEQEIISSDINEDGIINVLDIVLIVDIIFES